MIVFLDTSEDLKVCAEELGCEVYQLFTPLTRFKPQHDELFAIDNGAYSKFDAQAYRALLGRESGRKRFCKFVAAPDVVGSARRTLEVFNHWYPALEGWPIALVAQDGQEDLRGKVCARSPVVFGVNIEWRHVREIIDR